MTHDESVDPGLFLAASITSTLAQGAEINWMTVDELEAAQAREPRKVMVDVYTKWCGPCKMMMRNTFTNGDVIAYLNENFYAVKFDAEGPDPVEFKGQTFSNPNYVPNKPGRNGVHELSRAFQVRAYPTLVYLDENLEMIAPISGYKNRSSSSYTSASSMKRGRRALLRKIGTTFQQSFTPTFN